MLYQAPSVSEREAEVIDEIDAIRKELIGGVRISREWTGLPWRAIGPSADASAASTDRPSIAGYRAALTWLLQLVEDPTFTCDEGIIRGLHHLIVGHDPAKYPGCWRRSRIFVRKEEGGDVVYQGPDPRLIPALMAELVATINARSDIPLMVRAAVAHFNLSAIHPFLDGNGRLARALHSLVLMQGGIVAPPFASIDEYLSVNGGAYDLALRSTHGGRWQPERDSRPFVHFCLTAHYHQATMLRRRTQEYDHLWEELEREVQRRGLPDRMVSALAQAAVGGLMTNAEYRAVAGISPRVAASDLKRLVSEHLLVVSDEAARLPAYVAADAIKSVRARTLNPYEPEGSPFPP